MGILVKVEIAAVDIYGYLFIRTFTMISIIGHPVVRQQSA